VPIGVASNGEEACEALAPRYRFGFAGAIMPHKPASIKPDLVPAIDAEALLAWYDRNARLLPWRVGPAERAGGTRPDPYRVWLSEVMLQQTTVATATRHFRSFVARWPRLADLAAAPREAVLAEWAGLGYYARARNLHACARILAREHDGEFPETAADLQRLPGIGPYTAAAIAAICFDAPVAVVDGNVERVAARLLALDRPPRQAKAEVADVIARAMPARAGDFAQALMDLGATICAPKSADCDNCPLAACCAARASGHPLDWPLTAPARPRPQRYGHAFVFVRSDGAVWLERRAETGMLAAMTATPGSEWTDSAAAPRFPSAAGWRNAGEVAHVFTHFGLRLEVWRAEVDGGPDAAGWWSTPDRMAAEALPTLYVKVLEKAGISVRKAA
jgi:A/G-specific adenine glycosylase